MRVRGLAAFAGAVAAPAHGKFNYTWKGERFNSTRSKRTNLLGGLGTGRLVISADPS